MPLQIRRTLPLVALVVALLAASAPAAVLVDHPVLSVEAPEVRVAPGGTTTFALTLRIKKPFHIYDHREANATTLDPGDGAPLGIRVTYPEGHDFTLIPGEPPVKVYSGDTALRVTLAAPADLAPGPLDLPLALRYFPCDDKTCLPPRTDEFALRVTVDADAPATQGDPGEPAVTDAGGTTTPSPQDDARAQLDRAFEQGLPWMLVIVFAFGLALNVTPCVFPLLPVTMGFFASQGEGRPSRTFPIAAVYVLSMAAVFTVLGVAASLAGSQIGFFLGSLAGRLVIAAVMLALAASLFGAFEIHVPLGFLAKMQGKKGWIGALLMGLAAGLIAAPCVGPLVSALVAFVAQRGDVLLGALLFFTLALGMGSPYLLLGVFTGLINKVPRGGGYLIWFRQLLAFPLLAMAAYFLRDDVPAGFAWALYAAVALAGAIYLGLIEGRSRQPWSPRFIVARVITAMLLTAAAVAAITLGALPAWGLAGEAPEAPLVWQKLEDNSLEQAAADGVAAVVYFNGTPCPYCEVMNRRTFRGAEVIAAAEGVRMLKRDVYETVGGRAGELKKDLSIAGPPRLLFFDRTGKLVTDRSGVVPRDEFLSLLKQIR